MSAYWRRKHLIDPIAERQQKKIDTFASEMWHKEFLKYNIARSDSVRSTWSSRRFFNYLWSVMEHFGKQTTIHGFKWFSDHTTGRFGRFIWLLLFLAAFIFLIFVGDILMTRYNRQEFKTTVNDTNYLVYKISFPEVVICNENRLNWARLSAAKQSFLAKQHQMHEYEQLFTEITASFCTLTYGTFNKFSNLTTKPLAELNYINFTAVVDFMAWRCDEILDLCFWNELTYNCCEIFFPRKSQNGQCLAFNTIESWQGLSKQKSDPYWPWRTRNMGPGTGLRVRVLLKEQQQIPHMNKQSGIEYILNEPHVWYNNPSSASKLTRTTVSVDANFYFNDKTTNSLPPAVRECVHDYETNSPYFKTLKDHKYMYENCQTECQQQTLMLYCNCTMELFFPPGPYPVCKLVDFPCLAEHNDQLRTIHRKGQSDYVAGPAHGIPCECYPNCNSLHYLTSVSSFVLSEEELAINESYVDLDVFFTNDYIITFRTELMRTYIDLLVALGSIAGLCIGCSLISLIEILYFLIIDLPKSLWRACKRRQLN